MDNQHRKISGYRELSQEEIDLMNQIKALGPVIESVVAKLAAVEVLDQRWLILGTEHLQQGLMCLTRSVAKPDFF